MATYSDHAIILKRTDFDEAKRVVTFLTRNHGKISAIAPGVRKVVTRKGSHLELFNYSKIFLVKGRNLDIITEAETIDAFENIRTNLEKIGTAYYIVELVDALIPEKQRNTQVFHLTLAVLKKLNQVNIEELKNRKTEELLRNFEVQLLKNLGFWSDEVHGKNYPKDVAAQARFNQLLIEQIIERELHTPKIFKNI